MLEQENDLSLASDLSDTNSALDSGFLSGPQAIYSGEIDSALDDSSAQLSSKEKHQSSHNDSTHFTADDKRQKSSVDTNTDSGIMISGGNIAETGLSEASIRDGDGNTALHLAIKNDDLKTVEAVLTPITGAELKEYHQSTNQLPHSNARRQFSIDLEQRNFYGENCVHIATERNQKEILQLLIREGVDINAREGRCGYTPLHIAVENNNVELVTFFFENTKRLNTETLCYRRVTAYQLACELGYTEMIKTLQRCGCEVISPPDSDIEDSDDSMDDLDSE